MMVCKSGNVLSKSALGGVFGSGHANVHMGKAEACLPIEASPKLKRARPQCLRPPNARNLEMWHRTQRTNQTKPRSRNASDPLMPVMPILGLCNFDTQEKYATKLEAQTKPNHIKGHTTHPGSTIACNLKEQIKPSQNVVWPCVMCMQF